MDEELLKIAKEEVAHNITIHCIQRKLDPIAFFLENTDKIAQQVEMQYIEIEKFQEEFLLSH